MRRGRLGLLMLGTAIAGSQAGHLIAFQLRFGAAAQSLQSAGPHAYFPSIAKTAIGSVSLALLVSVAIVGAARVASRRRIERQPAPPAVRLLALLFTAQLAFFMTQETVEALLGGAHMATAVDLVLWGTAGQLPVAIVAAFSLRWLAARLEPSLRTIATVAWPAQPFIAVFAPALVPLPAPVGVERDGGVGAFTWRGPPSF